MACKNCGSERILSVNGKCSDCCSLSFNNVDQVDYNPGDCGIGSGDYIRFELCLNCGQIQGDFPIEDPTFSLWDEDEEDGEEY